MDNRLIKFGILLLFLFVIVLAIIPISVTNTKYIKFKEEVNKELKFLHQEIDSLRKIKNDTIFIKPLKIEIYEHSKS